MHLFLLGNTGALSMVVPDFMALAGPAPRIAVLCAGEKWPRYAPHYLSTFLEAGASEVLFVGEDEGVLNLDRARSNLERCTALVMTGGDTYQHQRNYVVSELCDPIREKVGQGTPYLGISAGAMLTCLTCLVPAPDRAKTPGPRYLPGFGFLTTLVYPHFSEWDGQQELQAAMKELYLQQAWGLDEQAALHLHHGQVIHTYGQTVWEVPRVGNPQSCRVDAPILVG